MWKWVFTWYKNGTFPSIPVCRMFPTAEIFLFFPLWGGWVKIKCFANLGLFRESWRADTQILKAGRDFGKRRLWPRCYTSQVVDLGLMPRLPNNPPLFFVLFIALTEGWSEVPGRTTLGRLPGNRWTRTLALSGHGRGHRMPPLPFYW